MTRHSSSLSEEPRSPRSITSSQSSHHHHLHPKSLLHGASPTKRSSGHSHTASQTLKSSPLKMVTTSTASHHHHHHHSSHGSDAYYYQPTMAAHEAQPESQGWMVPTDIEDDDLMFGGKSLSAWYEEERMQISNPEEERRGRQRVRQHHSHSHHHHHHHHKSKTSSSSSDQKKH